MERVPVQSWRSAGHLSRYHALHSLCFVVFLSLLVSLSYSWANCQSSKPLTILAGIVLICTSCLVPFTTCALIPSIIPLKGGKLSVPLFICAQEWLGMGFLGLVEGVVREFTACLGIPHSPIPPMLFLDSGRSQMVFPDTNYERLVSWGWSVLGLTMPLQRPSLVCSNLGGSPLRIHGRFQKVLTTRKSPLVVACARERR